MGKSISQRLSRWASKSVAGATLFLGLAAALPPLSACSANGNKAASSLGAAQGPQNPGGPDGRVCATDTFHQNGSEVPGKLDVLFVVDTSKEAADLWQETAEHIDSFLDQLPNVDLRFAVILGHTRDHSGRLYAPQGEPLVLDAQRMSRQEISNHLKTIFAQASHFLDPGLGEAGFYSLTSLVKSNYAEAQQAGFLRPDAALNVLFQSREEEIGYPFPAVPPGDILPRCDADYVRLVKKEKYDPAGITLDSTWAAVTAFKKGLPVSMNAIVNLGEEDMEHYRKVLPSNNQWCVFASPGYGYYQMVRKAHGVLESVFDEPHENMERWGRAAIGTVALQHDFKLSHPAAEVDPATIQSKVDGSAVPGTFSPASNSVHLDNAGHYGSEVDISYCQPQQEQNWSIEGLTGLPTQTAVNLNWQTTLAPTSGQLNWGSSPNALTNTVADPSTGTAHSVVVTGLQPDTTYYFQAISTDSYGITKKSSVLAVKTKAPILPSWTISNFAGSSTQIAVTLGFDTTTYATTGQILWGTSASALTNSTPADASPVTSHSFTVTGLQPNTTYFFQATATDDKGQTHQSGVISVTTQPVVLPSWSITGLNASATETAISAAFLTSDYPTTGHIAWGTDPAQLTNSTQADSAPTNSHSFQIPNLQPGTTYFLQAVATDDQGQTKQSAVISVTTLPAWTIESFAGTSTTKSVQLSFVTSGTATTGKVLWGTNANALTNSTPPDASPVNSHSFTVSGLQPGTTYFFQAVASDNFGQTQQSAVITLTTQALPSWSISGFAGTPTANNVSLNFSTAAFATTGKVLWGTSASALTNSTPADASPVKDHSFTVSSLQPNTTYYFQAVATDSFGQTQQSQILSLTTLPVWVINDFAGTPTNNSVALSFTTPAFATTGLVVWGTNPNALANATPSETNPVNSHSFTVAGLQPSTTYYFQAIATDKFGQVQQSPVISVTTLPSWAISGFGGTVTTNSASLNFTTAGFATTGLVKWGTSASSLTNSTAADASPVNNHIFNVTGLQPNTTYYFQAVASDSFGQNQQSQVISLTTQALPTWSITGFAGTASTNSVSLNFATAGFATTGLVKWGTSANALTNSTPADASPVNSHSFNVTGLQPNTTYFFQAVASDSFGQNQQSPVISVTTLPSWTISGFGGTVTTNSASLNFTTAGFTTTGQINWGTSASSLTNSTPADASPVNNHSFTVSGLQPNTTYYFQAVASDSFGQNQQSQVISLTTQALPTWSITGFAGTASTNSVSLNFATSGFVTIGQINWGTSPNSLTNSTPADASPVNNHSFTVSGLQPNTTYYFQAVASDSFGQNQQSQVISVTTKAVNNWTIQGFDGTTTATTATIIWQTPGTPTTGTLFVGLSPTDLTFTTVQAPVANTSQIVNVTGLSPATTYYFQVVALDANGTQVTSGILSKTTKAAVRH
jgi:phosphodiesterase/alkaline phosphatase D-like protein